MTWTSSNRESLDTASLRTAGGALFRAVGAFVRDPIPPHYLAIDEAFVSLTPMAAEEAFAAALHRNPQTRAALRERYVAPPYTLDDLAACAPGTLGCAYRAHMLRYHLELSPFPPERLVNDFRYFRERTFQTHDIVHVLLGFGSDTPGEMGVIGFTLGQMKRHLGGLSAPLVFGGLYGGLMGFLYSLAALREEPEQIAGYGSALAEGYRLGWSSDLLTLVPFETMLDVPLDVLQRRYRIQPAS